jgi:hypothetical protein
MEVLVTVSSHIASLQSACAIWCHVWLRGDRQLLWCWCAPNNAMLWINYKAKIVNQPWINYVWNPYLNHLCIIHVCSEPFLQLIKQLHASECRPESVVSRVYRSTILMSISVLVAYVGLHFLSVWMWKQTPASETWHIFLFFRTTNKSQEYLRDKYEWRVENMRR